jgi:hypothetical protein
LNLGAIYDAGMGMLDDARKREAEAEARTRAMIEEFDRPREEERRRREEEDRLSEEQGRQLSEEFLNEVRTRHLEPNQRVYVIASKREWVRRRSDLTGKKSWGWSKAEEVNRRETGRCFLIVHKHFDDTTRRWVETRHGIDPTTGQELIRVTKLVETRPAIKRWLRRGRPKTEIYETSVVQRPLMNHPGLDSAILHFLEQPR